jgi:transposase
VRIVLTAGQAGDAPQAHRLLEGQAAAAVIADAAYDADHLREAVAAKRATAVIPSNPSRARRLPLDRHLYKERHLVECCIGKLKHFGAVADVVGNGGGVVSGLFSTPFPALARRRRPRHGRR